MWRGFFTQILPTKDTETHTSKISWKSIARISLSAATLVWGILAKNTNLLNTENKLKMTLHSPLECFQTDVLDYTPPRFFTDVF